MQISYWKIKYEQQQFIKSSNKSATWHLHYRSIVVAFEGHYCALGVFIDVAINKWRLHSAKLLKCNKKWRAAKPCVCPAKEARAHAQHCRVNRSANRCRHARTPTHTHKYSSVLAKRMSSVTRKLQRQHAAEQYVATTNTDNLVTVR